MAQLPRSCNLLVEDIDAAGIPSRDSLAIGNTSERPFLSLAAILNALDGVATPDDIMMIGTTNNPAKLDPALVRMGRFGIRILFTLATEEQMHEMFLRMYAPKESAAEIEFLAAKFASSIPEMTMSPAEIRTFLLMEPDPHKAVEGAISGLDRTALVLDRQPMMERDPDKAKKETMSDRSGGSGWMSHWYWKN